MKSKYFIHQLAPGKLLSARLHRSKCGGEDLSEIKMCQPSYLGALKMKNFTRSKNSRKWRIAMLSGAAVVLLLLALVVPGFAQSDVTGSLEITGGSLSLNSVDNPLFTGFTLDGTVKTLVDAIDIDVKDLRGSGAGWNLAVTSTTFTNGSSKTLPTTALSITGVAAACDVAGTCTDPTNNVSYVSGLAVPADAIAPAAVKFFNAAADTGLGDFTISPTFSLIVPATAYAGTYTSTITLTVANLP
jgi:hypothetical protein